MNSLQRLSACLVATAAVLVCLGAAAVPADAVRIKDIAVFSGVRDNQLVGYGLVVGLGGTGDKRSSPFTNTTVANMLQRMGIAVEDPGKIKPQNVAAVMVTARMPVSSKPGSRVDVTVASMGDASSLQGGVLLQTPLRGVDGKVYALAQGPLALGGYTIEGAAATAQKNIATVGTIPGGGIIERGVPFEFNDQTRLTLHMSTNDFSTAMQVVERLNATLGGRYAKALDPGTVTIDVPQTYRGNLVPLIASVENLEVTPQSVAKVVVDERTGTVVVGREVRVSQVAVAHGNLQIVVQESAQVSQPGPFSQGQTVVTPVTDIATREENRRLHMLEGATLQELVDGLNAIGATPRDLISILKTLKTSGALHAELEVM